MKTINAFLIILSIFFLGCDGCNLEDQLNNGNSNPEALYIELFGLDISMALALAYGCHDHPTSFFADVEIEVRTASLVDGQIIIDPNPYFEFDDEVEFFGNTGSIIQIEVPESGAYGITIDIEMQDCSICCHGEWEGQCSSYEYYDEGKEIWYCEAGKPQVAVEAIFPEQERPPYNYNWNPAQHQMHVRSCRACGCFVECN